MKYEYSKSKYYPDTWHVEAINYDGDGEIYMAVFSGPYAEQRALEYLILKNKQISTLDQLPHL